jgi:GNAT superfamily N-acetyltransferase
MNIRTATAEDLPQLLEMGRSMRDESPRFREFDFDARVLERTMRQVMSSRDGLLLVAERGDTLTGFAMAICVPSWFGNGCWSSDMAIFVRPECRGGTTGPRFIDLYRQWATQRGAEPVLFGVMTGVNVEQTQRLCERTGWRRAGVVMEA